MDYFELFGLPVQLSVDKEALKKKYFALSRMHHPDYFIQQEDAARQNALETSASINKAYKIFNNQDTTIKYVLEEKGLLAENEKYDLPAAFLMEMLELNESVEAAALDDGQKAATLQEVFQVEKELYEPVKSIIEQYKEGITVEKELLLVKDYYFKKKYIERLKQQLTEKL